jgi:hypothetical protein
MVNCEIDHELFSHGQLVYYTTAHLALLIAPEKGEDIWRVGLFINYINDKKESCIILDALGEERQCPTYMIQCMSQFKTKNT